MTKNGIKDYATHDSETKELVKKYLRMTTQTMPELAKQGDRQWPVSQDHCFQRIVLDTICNGAWYDSISSPAYKNLSFSQANSAVRLCEQIIQGQIDLHVLNQRSIQWRKKQQTFTF